MSTIIDNAGVVVRPPLLYAAAILAVLLLRWFWPMPISGDGAIVWPALALLVPGIGIVIWGRRALQAAATTVDPSRPTTAIVTAGPFRFTRNPLYVALTLIYLGLALAANSWWGAVLLVPLFATMHFGVVLREERYLARKFGETYRHYQASVRRYL